MRGTVRLPGGRRSEARVEFVQVLGKLETGRLLLEGVAAPEPAASTAVDKAGRFAIAVPRAGLWKLRVRAEDRVPKQYGPTFVSRSLEVPPVELEADAGARVEVVDSSGAPVSGAWIRARGSAEDADGWRPAPRLLRTGESGTLVFARAPWERLELSLFAPGFETLREEREALGGRFVLAPSEARRRVIHVRDAAGGPLAGVLACLGREAWPVGTTGAGGRLELAGPLSESDEIHLLTEGGVHRRVLLGGADPAVFTLPPPRTVAGAVFGGRDGSTPLAGALVWPGDDPGAWVTTDGHGRFTLTVSGPRSTIRAEADGHQPGMADPWSPGTGGGPRLVLEPARQVLGRVVDTRDRPVSGATVSLRPARGPDARKKLRSEGAVATTGAGGRFRLPGAPARRLDVTVRRRGFSPTLARAVRLPDGDGPADLGTLVLRPGAAIRGRARDAEGRALDGVSVWLSEDLHRPAADLASRRPDTPPAAVTDAAGLFAVEDLPAGARFHLLLVSDRHLPATRQAVEAPTREPLEVTLVPGFELRGRVVDEAGDAVAGAEVTLQPPSSSLGLMEVPVFGAEHHKRILTRDDGSFSFAQVAAGRFEVAADAEGFVPGEPSAVTVSPDGPSADLTLLLARGAAVAGRVTTAGGEPVAGARVRTDGGMDLSDAEGSYRLTGVPAGPREVEARHPVYRRVTREIEIEDGDNVLDLVFEPGHEVSGRVLDDRGVPVGRAVVALRLDDPEDPHRLRAATGPDGDFRFAVVGAGRYRLSAEKRGYAPAERPADVVVADRAVADLEVVLTSGAVIAGRITGLGAGELAAVRVEAATAQGTPRPGRVDHEGRYRVADLAAGDYLVRAWTGGGRRQAEARVVVEAGVGEVRRDLELGRGVALAGRVVLGDEPLPGARLTIRGRDVAAHRQVLSDHEGAFRVEDLEPGAYRVGVLHPRELVVKSEDVVVDADREILIEIGAGRFYGHVTSAEGELLEGATILMTQQLGPREDGSFYSTATDGEGFYALPRIPAGRYRVTVRRPGYGTREEMLDVDGFDVGPHTFELSATPGLDLEVRLASGSRPPYVTAAAAGRDGRYLTAESRPLDAGGRARLLTVPAGRWRVLVSAPGAAPAEITAEVPGDPVAVVLLDASRLRVRIPDLAESDRIATLRLADAEGRPFRGVDAAGRPVGEWRVTGGTAEIEGVPSGLWTLRASMDGDRTWEETIVTEAQPEVMVQLW